VAAAGFPSDVDDSVTGEDVFTLSTGTIDTRVRMDNTPWASTEIFNHSAKTAPGSSGGPVVDLATGDVLGVHYAGDGSRSRAIALSKAREVVETIMCALHRDSRGDGLQIHRRKGGRYRAGIPLGHSEKCQMGTFRCLG